MSTGGKVALVLGGVVVVGVGAWWLSSRAKAGAAGKGANPNQGKQGQQSNDYSDWGGIVGGLAKGIGGAWNWGNTGSSQSNPGGNSPWGGGGAGDQGPPQSGAGNSSSGGSSWGGDDTPGSGVDESGSAWN